MVRVVSAVYGRKRRKRVLKQTKGQFGHRSRRYVQATRSLARGLVFQFNDRRKVKGHFRSLWIARLNAACRAADITYSRFIAGLNKAKVEINRKVISELAINSPEAFNKLVVLAKSAL